MEDYHILGRIGEGAHGIVYKAKHIQSGEVVALKKVPLRKIEDGIPNQGLREIKALQEIGGDCEESQNGVKLKEAAQATKKIHDEISDIEDSIKDKQVEFEEKEKYEQQRMKKLDQCSLMVDSWRKEMSELNLENVQPQIDKLSGQLQEILRKINSIELDTQTIHSECDSRNREIKNCDRKIAHLNNLSNRRLEQLKVMNKDIFTAVEWLRRNRSMFKGVVYEPIMLLLNMTDERCAEILENHVSVRDMIAFVCEEPEDNALLVSELRGKRKLKINVVKAPRNRQGQLTDPSEYKPQKAIHQLSQWGFTNYLREMFTAPNPVMSYLCKQYGVHRVPVGSDKTLDIVDQVTERSGQNLFYIPSFQKPQSREICQGIRFSVKRSKYSGNSTVANRSLKHPQYLTTNVDPEQILELNSRKKQLQDTNKEATTKLSQFQGQKDQLEKKDNELRTRKKELQSQKSRKKTLENNIQMKLKMMEELRTNSVDVEQLRQQLRESLGQIYMNKKERALEFSEHIKDCTMLSLDKAHTTVKYVAAIAGKNRIDDKIRRGHEKVLEIQMKLEKSENDKKDAQKRAKQLLAEAKQRTGDDMNDDTTRVSKELMKLFSNLPGTVTELDTLIHDYKARAECCTSTDPHIIEEYNRRQKEIESLQKKVDSLDNQLQRSRNRIEGVKERWLTEINELIDSINVKFSRFFAQMGCAGEVELHKENPEEFDKYGIRIRVKFRSSSTLQGMDPYNERRVFDIIVRSYCDSESSQYFLITPKLLPNLTYNEHMTVHCIYNGHYMLPCSQWRMSRFKRHRRRLCYEDDE